MLRFRKAQTADLPDILRAVREAQAFMRTLNIDQWQDGYPDAAVLTEDIEIGQLYVFAEDALPAGALGSIAAFAALSLLPEPVYDAIDGAWRIPGPYLTVHRTALDDVHRGGGLAAEIIGHAVAIARAAGCASVRADTHPGNLAMRRFLEKQGFALRGTVQYLVKKGDPLRVAYEKAL